MEKNHGMLFLMVLLILSTSASTLQASELRYQPVNPSFGGNPFNGSFLLSDAESQNDNREPSKPSDPLKNFERAITNSLLARISQEIADQILGEEAKDSGTFTIGGTVLDFQRSGDIVTINILDTVNGSDTTIEVPAPVF